ncbi:hypothetical protein [Collimonas humicola]|nr:hypothetical protein [Collimonas humicola]
MQSLARLELGWPESFGHLRLIASGYNQIKRYAPRLLERVPATL